MKRLLLNLLSALSLLMCVAVTALWVRSYFASDELAWHPLSQSSGGYVSGSYTLHTRRGVLMVGAMRYKHDKAESVPAQGYMVYLRTALVRKFAGQGWTSRAPDDLSMSRWGFMGWTVDEREPGYRGIGVGWSMPFWFLLLCCTPLGVRALLVFARRRQRRPGLCATCGYDLRATPDRCPECGTAVPSTTGKL